MCYLSETQMGAYLSGVHDSEAGGPHPSPSLHGSKHGLREVFREKGLSRLSSSFLFLLPCHLHHLLPDVGEGGRERGKEGGREGGREGEGEREGERERGREGEREGDVSHGKLAPKEETVVNVSGFSLPRLD